MAKEDTTKDKSNDVQGELRESAHKIWLAGLGALAVAGEEGKNLFRTLVEKGEEFEGRGRVRVDKVKGKVKDARSNVEMAFERAQEGFDDKVASALHRMGVPTRAEISKLTKRVEDLTKSIEKLREKPAAKPKKSGGEPAGDETGAS